MGEPRRPGMSAQLSARMVCVNHVTKSAKPGSHRFPERLEPDTNLLALASIRSSFDRMASTAEAAPKNLAWVA